MPNLTGQSIGRYHILEQLGEGGMATVYKAYDTRLERNVALKVLRTDQFIPAQLHLVLQRFEREAKSLAKISHPSIVNVLDFGKHEDQPFLVMEYLPGGTLKRKLGNAIPWRETFKTILPVARGLAYAHQHGIVHRDVKPVNILMNEFDEPVLTDFGIAKLLEGAEGHTLTGSGVGIGTPDYMAPEQGMGASTIDARADIYSLGIVLYEMIAGRKPYIADTPMAVVLKQLNDPLPRPTDFVPDIPEGVEKILFKALAKQPEDRYVDMNALITSMESLLATSQMAKAQAGSVLSRKVKKKAALRAKPSDKVIKTVVGTLVVIAIIVLGVMVAPKISGIFASPAPANTASPPVTITKISIATPTMTPTRTPRLTSTPTPPPVWVKDFAEPILSTIANYPPTLQDDLHDNLGGWYPGHHDNSYQFQFVDNELIFDDCSANRSKMAYTDFVLELDFQIYSNSHLRIYYRNLYGFLIQQDGHLEIGLSPWTKETPIDIPREVYNPNHVLLIAKGNRYAFYVNEKPIYYLEDSYFFTKEAIFFVAHGKVGLDNLKIWDLEKIPNLP